MGERRVVAGLSGMVGIVSLWLVRSGASRPEE
jgi:hypothetical protein